MRLQHERLAHKRNMPMQETGAIGWLYPCKLHAICPSRVPFCKIVMQKNLYPSTCWWGVMIVDTKLSNLCRQTSSYPMLNDRLLPLAVLLSIEDNDATVMASNYSPPLQYLECANAITIAATHAIVDTGAVSIFIMKGMPIKNLRWADHLITITLPDGS
jgi:hypothetical protein